MGYPKVIEVELVRSSQKEGGTIKITGRVTAGPANDLGRRVEILVGRDRGDWATPGTGTDAEYLAHCVASWSALNDNGAHGWDRDQHKQDTAAWLRRLADKIGGGTTHPAGEPR